MSRTRRMFLAKRAARIKQRADDKAWGERTFFCLGYRDKRGVPTECKFEVVMATKHSQAATCRRCGTHHVRPYDEWMTAEQATIQESKYGSLSSQGNENTGATLRAPDPDGKLIGQQDTRPADHEDYCGYKDVQLVGLRRVQRPKAAGNNGEIKLGIGWIDHRNAMRHWCRAAKGPKPELVEQATGAS